MYTGITNYFARYSDYIIKIGEKINLKILITGASGLLGREIVKILSNSHKTEGWAYSRVDKFMKIDLFDFKLVEKAFFDFSPDILIHSAAERRPDVMKNNPHKAWKMNVDISAYLSELCSKNNTFIIFISTDYVFDGTSPPYIEESKTCPLNLYGESKEKAEKMVRDKCSKNCIIRIPILYGPTKDLNESAVTILASQLLSNIKKEVFINDGAIRYPTLTNDVAKAIKLLIEKGSSGTFHISAEEPYTKYSMAKLIVPFIDFDINNIFPDTTLNTGTKRPLNSHLNNTKIRRLGFKYYTPFKEGLSLVFNTFKS